MKKYILVTGIVFFSVLSCNTKEKEAEEAQPKTIVTDSVQNEKQKIVSVYNYDTLAVNNVLINNHDILLSKSEFESLYRSKIDSTSTDVWEGGSAFEWMDKDWMIKMYGEDLSEFDGKITTIYAKNIVFSTNNHKVLFEEGHTNTNTFKIISHNIVLDKNTTLEAFKKMFPKVKFETTEVPGEIRFDLPIGKDYDDEFLIIFKNGKLDYLKLWFLL